MTLKQNYTSEYNKYATKIAYGGKVQPQQILKTGRFDNIDSAFIINTVCNKSIISVKFQSFYWLNSRKKHAYSWIAAWLLSHHINTQQQLTVWNIRFTFQKVQFLEAEQ